MASLARTTFLSLTIVCVFLPTATAQPPYTAKLLGPGTVINDMNLSGEVVGWTIATGQGVQAYVAGPGHAFETLPLPSGYASAWAQGINDAGVIVGSVSTGGFPEFGEALAWVPNGQGGYSMDFLGQLPGHAQSVAYDVNNRGDIIGESFPAGFQGGPAVWFNAPGGVLDLGSLGAPSSPREINDEGVMIGWSGGLFDIDTLSASPLPPFSGNQSGFQGWAINDRGELAGTGFFGGTQRAAVRWTAAGGWQPVSGFFNISAQVTAFDINEDGLTVLEAPTPSAHFTGLGTFPLSSLLAPSQQGQWSFVLSLGAAVNDFGQIAAIGIDQTTGSSGVVLMTPAGFQDLGFGRAGTTGVPVLAGSGSLAPMSPVSVSLAGALPSSSTFLIVGTSFAGAPFLGGTLVPSPDWVIGPLPVDAAGALVLNTTWPSGVPVGFSVYLQCWIADPGAFAGAAASNGLMITQP